MKRSGPLPDDSPVGYVSKRMRAEAAAAGERSSPSFCARPTTIHGTCVRWFPSGTAFLSTGMDGVIKVWDVQGGRPHEVSATQPHSAGVREVAWNCDNSLLHTASYDQTSLAIDPSRMVAVGPPWRHESFVQCVAGHPEHPNLVVTGDAEAHLLLWDTRHPSPVRAFSGAMGEFQSVCFLSADEIVASAAVTRRNSLDKAVQVWDLHSGQAMSNQIYQEGFTCPCVCRHPTSPYFVIQSNADYIAVCSTHRPYKLDKLSRFEGHTIAGYPIRCVFSPDGRRLVTGSSDGRACIYNWHTRTLAASLQLFAEDDPCVSVDCCSHHTAIVACSWQGGVVFRLPPSSGPR